MLQYRKVYNLKGDNIGTTRNNYNANVSFSCIIQFLCSLGFKKKQ